MTANASRHSNLAFIIVYVKHKFQAGDEIPDRYHDHSSREKGYLVERQTRVLRVPQDPLNTRLTERIGVG